MLLCGCQTITSDCQHVTRQSLYDFKQLLGCCHLVAWLLHVVAMVSSGGCQVGMSDCYGVTMQLLDDFRWFLGCYQVVAKQQIVGGFQDATRRFLCDFMHLQRCFQVGARLLQEAFRVLIGDCKVIAIHKSISISLQPIISDILSIMITRHTIKTPSKSTQSTDRTISPESSAIIGQPIINLVCSMKKTENISY